MLGKKSTEPDKTPEEEAIERRVDEMMSVKPIPTQPAKPEPEKSKIEIPKLATAPTIVKPEKLSGAAKTAPKLPPADATKPSAEPYKLKTPDKPPVVIKLADDTQPSTTEPVATEPKAGTPLSKSSVDDKDPLSDTVTDKAVDEIAAKEADTILALADAKSAKKHPSNSPDWRAKLAAILKNKWTWIGLAAILLILLAVPITRYKLLGLAIKKPITISVIDSKEARPVSNANVNLAGQTVKTDANGKAHLKTPVGPHPLSINKQYYQTYRGSYFVGFKSSTAQTSIKLVATGRLVPITVVNKITGKPVGGVEVRVLDTAAKTNSAGQATLALPTTNTTDAANLKLSGYNTAHVTIQVTDQVVKANKFEITPAGHVYFLSNLSGKIDVVKANLDGTGRKTVLAGTGREDAATTSLLASRDWRYLVLKAKHDSSTPSLYLIDTSTDKIVQFDNSGASFELIGWYGHSFIYSLTKPSLTYWQTGRKAIKSYDADNSQLNQLDQNQAEGDASKYAYQDLFNFYILNGGGVAYNTQWYSYTADGSDYNLDGKTDSIRSVQVNGQNKKDYQTFPASTTAVIEAILYEPQAVYYAVHDNANKTAYYSYENQAAKTANIDESTFAQPYPTYLISPSGNQTFWTELRDGKNTLFIGDAKGGSKKQIASLSDYAPYGWFSDNYTLVAKSSSELYIMPAGGLAKNRQPLKITDYYKPAQTYNGYGYGYGGL